jgi:hypothetical protein
MKRKLLAAAMCATLAALAVTVAGPASAASGLAAAAEAGSRYFGTALTQGNLSNSTLIGVVNANFDSSACVRRVGIVKSAALSSRRVPRRPFVPVGADAQGVGVVGTQHPQSVGEQFLQRGLRAGGVPSVSTPIGEIECDFVLVLACCVNAGWVPVLARLCLSIHLRQTGCGCRLASRPDQVDGWSTH